MPNSGLLRVIPENIPPLLKGLLCCVWVPKFQNRGEVPISAIHGQTLMSNAPFPHPRDWSCFDTALSAYGQSNYAGIAVLLRSELGVIRIIIHRCTDADGNLNGWASSAVTRLATYWERLPNGLGIQAFVRGVLPPECRNRFELAAGMIDLSTEQHISPVTGHRLAGSAEEVETCREQLESFLSWLREQSVPQQDLNPGSITDGTGEPETPQSGPPSSESAVELAPLDDGPPIETSPTWREPQPITVLLPQVQPFVVEELMPRPLIQYVCRAARDLQVRVESVAALMMGALSGAAMRRVQIRPKPRSSWVVHPIVWTLLVQRSGSLKSPTFSVAMRPLEELQAEAFRQFQTEMAAFKEERRENPEAEPPTCRRFIVNDVTFAALHKVLQENQLGVLLARDELMGLFQLLHTRGHEQDRQFLLEAWSGTRGFTVDRIGRGLIQVERVAVAIIGTIQPTLMQRMVRAAVEKGDFADGFLPRFQFAIWPDESPEWEYIDEEGDTEAYERVFTLFRQITESGEECPREYRFDPDAQAVFEEYLGELEYRIRKQETDSIMREHLGKFRSLMPTIALLLQVAEDFDCQVIPLQRARRAWRWCEFLESHARRIYACVLSDSTHPMRTLADRIVAGALGNRFSVRDVYSHNWSGLTTPDSVRAILLALEAAGWVLRTANASGPRGGRPSEIFDVNPKVFRT